ncbi:MAG: N-acetylmuramoyl-L-alanine amidase [Nitrospirales bacterium]|nr:N-acetylmuramoyl-L-alanine amidase [Nitrospirales bacterium]
MVSLKTLAVFIPLFFLSCLFSFVSPAEALEARGGGEATVRVGKHDSYWRIVFTSTEENVQKASVVPVGKTSFRVDFPASLSFSVLERDGKARQVPSGSFPLEVVKELSLLKKDGGCLITVENLASVSVSRLSSPWRLIVDASFMAPGALPPPAPAPAVPVPIPSPAAVSLSVGLIGIDPGHGGYDNGIEAGGRKEKEIALSVATELGAVVARAGGRSFLTRKSDRSLPIGDRIAAVRKRAVSVLVSIHISSQDGFTLYAPYAEAGIAPGSKRLSKAQTVQAIALTTRVAQGLREELGLDVRTERLPLPLVQEAGIPAILVELPSPAGFAYDTKTIKKIAQALSRAIMAEGETEGVINEAR